MIVRRSSPSGYRVAVPSYRRADGLAAKTLLTLLDGGVDADRVVVFVHDNDPEVDAYRALAASTGVGLAVTDARGIIAQRARIAAHFPPGAPVVSVDDDVTRVDAAVDAKTLRPVPDLDSFFRGMFLETSARDLWVWGLSPVANPFYMTPGRLTEGLRFLIFTMIGVYNRPAHPVQISTVPSKDDYELSLRAWWYDGAVLRHDGAVARANLYTDPGGLQAPGPSQRTAAQVAASVAALESDWPGLVRRNTRRADGPFVEILLAPKKRHPGHPAAIPVPGRLRDRATG